MTLQQRSGLQFRDFGKNPNDFVNTDGRLVLDVPWNVQGPGDVPAARRVPGLRELLAPRRRPHRAARHRSTRRSSGRPRARLILLQPRGELGRIPSVTFLDMRLQKDFKLGKNVRFSVFARRPEPPQRGRLRRRPELDRARPRSSSGRSTPSIRAADAGSEAKVLAACQLLSRWGEARLQREGLLEEGARVPRAALPEQGQAEVVGVAVLPVVALRPPRGRPPRPPRTARCRPGSCRGSSRRRHSRDRAPRPRAAA